MVPFRSLSLILIIFLTLLSGFLFLRSDLFQIKALEFEFEESAEGVRLSDEALVRQRIMEEVLARNIFFLDSTAVEEKVKENFPTIKAISLERAFPDKLLVRVAVRVPLAIVEDKNKARFLVDGEGLLFREASQEESLPLISLGGDFKGEVGQRVSGRAISGYLETLRLAEESGLKTAAIYLRPNLIELRLVKTVVLVSTDKEIAPQIEILSQLLLRYQLGGRTPKSVDLRFGRPVVRL